MAEERLVFRRQISLDQLLRKIGILQLHAPFTGVGMDDVAINPAHHRGQRSLIDNQPFRIGQIARQEHPNADQHAQPAPQPPSETAGARASLR